MLLEYVFANAIMKSTGARECLEEVKTLASGDPGRVEVVLLPKTRQFLSYLKSNPLDTATQPVADPIVPTTTTIFSPAAVLPNGTHEWGNRVDTVSAYEVSAALPPANDLGNMPVIDEASLSTFGLSGYFPSANDHQPRDGGNWNLPMPDNWNDTANRGSAGPSAATYHASLNETRAVTLGNGANWGEDTVDWLRGLAWSMGYYLIPRGAAIPGGALV
ncbi:uncharacterized protein EI90DRAFT_3131533 [Cantharellus anzutake]|uniref:uncharacterized protein n=1 Tax=Cantharellus anzutake TaxID=1750568 RepID=UPI001907FBAE|nr:uncharacterized protein EI90DRAFT_3131533 [Cantharellus anzutake]KAF8321877.1 hypothetical protein EI90DRAFT_3131533 [Cantharellus anzutake]